jgi:hypothetical protein
VKQLRICTASTDTKRSKKRFGYAAWEIHPVMALHVDQLGNYAKFRSRSHDAVIRVCDDAGNVIETRKHAGEFK